VAPPPPTVLTRIPPVRTTVQQVHLPLRAPWSGYVPDLAQVYRGVDGLISCLAINVSGGRVVLVDGWEKMDIEIPTLPLGHDGDTNAFQDLGGNRYGAGASPANTTAVDPQDTVQPVMHLTSIQRFSAATGLGSLEAIAITADTGAIPNGGGVAPFQETGHLFRKPNAAGGWFSLEFRSENGNIAAPNPVGTAVPLSGTTNDWIDSSVYTPGVPGTNGVLDTDPTGATDDRRIREVAESVLIFTNYLDQIYYYPDRTGDPNYTDFSSYAAQLSSFATQVNTHNNGFGQVPEFTSLRAKSLANFAGRMFYFNTVEDGVFRATRLRWSIAGNPFIVWPSFEIDMTTPAFHMDGVGAGYFDLDQFRTPGQRSEVLGDVLACYSKDGVAFARRTGIPTDPISVEYVTLDRGILSPGCVTPITAAQHFAIMSDGWYLVNANGVLQEVGISPERAGGLLGGAGRTYKWKEDFYRRLDFDEIVAGRLLTKYEPATKLVRIAVPMVSGYIEIWNYDTQNDRVFLDDYSNVGGIDQQPRSLGLVPRHSGTATTWFAAGPTSWEGYTGRSWASFGVTVFTELEYAHGDSNGFVYIHDPLLATRDGGTPNWHFRTAPRSLADNPDLTVLIDGVVVTYDNQESTSGALANIQVSGSSHRHDSTSVRYTETYSVDMTRGDVGELAVDDAGFRVPGENHQIGIQGTGAVSIHELRLRVVVEGTGHRRLEGSA
jgi:hypothetical protein